MRSKGIPFTRLFCVYTLCLVFITTISLIIFYELTTARIGPARFLVCSIKGAFCPARFWRSTLIHSKLIENILDSLVEKCSGRFVGDEGVRIIGLAMSEYKQWLR